MHLDNVATETREDGKTASYTYNEQNKLTSATGYNGATVTYSYDGNGNMVTSTKPDGTAITYTYDDKHRMYPRQTAEVSQQRIRMTDRT